MEILVILIIVSLVIALVFLILFVWSVKSDQYEDTDSPAMRIFIDDKPRSKSTTTKDKK